LSRLDNRTCYEPGRKFSCLDQNGGCDQICTDPVLSRNRVTTVPQMKLLSTKKKTLLQVTVASFRHKTTPASEIVRKLIKNPQLMVEANEGNLAKMGGSEISLNEAEINPTDSQDSWETLTENFDDNLVTCTCREGFELQDDETSCLPTTTTTVSSTTTVSTTSTLLSEEFRHTVATSTVSLIGRRDHCSYPLIVGQCDENLPSWYYDIGMDDCYEFIYTGCNGNLNR